MKKVIFSLVLTLGVFVSMQAQTLYVHIVNGTTSPWTYTLTDGNSNPPAPAIGTLAGGAVYNGTINNFAFNLTWLATNLATGCSNGNTMTGPTPFTTVGLFCSIPPPPPGSTVSYKCEPITGTFDWSLKVALN